MKNTEYLRKGFAMPPYLLYPLFLLDMALSDSARLVYILLLNRSRLSARRQGYSDEAERIFVNYPIEELARDCHRCTASVKQALSQLEKLGLLERKQQGGRQPGRIYVKLPDTLQAQKTTDRSVKNHTAEQKEFTHPGENFLPIKEKSFPPAGKDPFCPPDIFLSKIHY